MYEVLYTSHTVPLIMLQTLKSTVNLKDKPKDVIVP